MKFATIAAVGVVSANWRVNREAEHHPHSRWWTGEPTDCSAMNKEENLKDWELMKRFHYILHNSVIKGAYHKDGHVIDDKCYGDWMDETRPQLDTTFIKIKHGDIWGISH